MNIRDATSQDFAAIWPIFHAIVSAGETYGFARDTSLEQARQLWMEQPLRTFVVDDEGDIVGTYFLKANQGGPGAHVCNCGYMVAAAARGKGVATAMCEHSQVVARKLGFKAMQFNYVAQSNVGAARLWQRLGFQIVGTVPKAFMHPTLGYVGAHVMYKWLDAGSDGSATTAT